MTVPVDILMLTTGNWQYAKRAILALAHRTADPYRLIVVDSGSDHHTQALLTDMVSDGFVNILVLMPGYSPQEGWRAGQVLTEGRVIVYTSDVWLPPTDNLGWLETLVATLERHPEYATVALKPSFFPQGLPPLRRDGELQISPWLESSFICSVRGHARAGLKAGYLREVRAEYLPSLALT